MYNNNNDLISILYEVKNTFGEQHTYVFKVKNDNLLQHNCEKKFHVSPFIEMNCSYFGYGFHEDGIKSSIEMLKTLND